MKKLITIFLASICLVGLYVGWTAFAFLHKPAQKEKAEVVFDVPNGSSFSRISSRLKAQGLIHDDKLLNLFARFTGYATKIKTGEYLLHTHMRPRDILSVITSGQSITYSLVVPEGYNVYEIRDAFNLLLPNKGTEFFNVVHDKNKVKKLLGRESYSLEGYLFPDTYIVTKYTPAEAVVDNMFAKFQQVIQEVRKNAPLQMSVQDQVTLASVIEKETGAPEERPMIASVFHNRLRKGMRLESDPTILYGLLVTTNEAKKNITRADIRAPTPFNTYTVKALPAGPIANPGRDALRAAVDPATSEYFFFVSRNDGTHVFTPTYKEHKAAVKRYQLDPKMREGRSWRDLKTRNQ